MLLWYVYKNNHFERKCKEIQGIYIFIETLLLIIMDYIFNFTKTYAGAIIDDQNNYPCSLDFIDNDIIFTVITESEFKPKGFRQPFDFHGYMVTEDGVKNFRAGNAIQILRSYNWSTYSKQQFQVKELLISHESNDIFREEFHQLNIVFNNLSNTGIFLNIKLEPSTTDKFSVEQTFKELSLLKNETQLIEVNNPYNWAFDHSKNIKLLISVNPFITYISGKGLRPQKLKEQAIQISWFLQLVFGIRQRIVKLVLFDPPTNSLPENSSPSPYYYFYSDMIRDIQASGDSFISPFYRFEKLAGKLPEYYGNWHNFDPKQKLICRLFFNEINSNHVVLDDRFKNFCSIIQGLDAFGVPTKGSATKGEMNRKLQNTLDEDLKEYIFKNFGENFICELFKIIGDQRDLFQHLNKSIKFDLNNVKDDIIAANQLMAMLIKYHIWKKIGFSKPIIKTLIDREIEFFKIGLYDLKRRLNL